MRRITRDEKKQQYNTSIEIKKSKLPEPNINYLVDLKTGEIINKEVELTEAEKQKEQMELFNKKQEEFHKEQRMRSLIYKILGPSKREREEAQKQIVKEPPKASEKFYTWKKGATASKTSHNAWGHRRNGGGKGKIMENKIMNSLTNDKKIEQRNEARKLRRKNNKEKAKEEEEERIERAKKIECILKEKMVTTPTSEPLEETEYQKFKRKELEDFNDIHCKKMKTEPEPKKELNDQKKNSEDKIVKLKIVSDDNWKIVSKKTDKHKKIAEKITKALFVDKKESKTFTKRPMSNENRKTILCKSVLYGTKCIYPPGKCNFAHNSLELQPRSCMNRKCKFVKCINNEVFINNGSKKCMFIHEGETKNNFVNRLVKK